MLVRCAACVASSNCGVLDRWARGVCVDIFGGLCGTAVCFVGDGPYCCAPGKAIAMRDEFVSSGGGGLLSFHRDRGFCAADSNLSVVEGGMQSTGESRCLAVGANEGGSEMREVGWVS